MLQFFLVSHENSDTASHLLQKNLNEITSWMEKWRIKANEAKSIHVTYTLKKKDCPPVTMNGSLVSQAKTAKYLGIHIDRKLTWRDHIFTKRKQLGIKFSKMYWLINRKSSLSLESKLMIYKSILKPIWTYGVQVWGTASKSNLEILQRFQSKMLRIIVNAPWYVPNTIIQRDLNVQSVVEVIKTASEKYRDRISVHPNCLASRLMTDNDTNCRLKRIKPTDLSVRFN